MARNSKSETTSAQAGGASDRTVRGGASHLRSDGTASGTDTQTGSGLAYRIKLLKTEEPASFNSSMLTGIVLVLVVIGLVMVFSSSSVEEFARGNALSTRFLRQGIFALIGIPLMLVASRIPTRFWSSSVAWLALFFAMVLQALVFTPLGVEVNGNRAWLNLGVITIQPAEFAKVALAIWLGMMITRKGEQLRDLKNFVIPIGLPVAFVLGLALMGKDLGTVMVIGALVLGALWFGGIRRAFIVGATAIAVGGAIFMAAVSPNRVARITSFFAGNCDYEGLCWQTSHGFYALARGGVFGVGLGNSTAKWSWLPEADNDFIFAIIGEELGLIGGFVVILLIAAMGIMMLRVWKESVSPAGRVITGAIFSWFIFQAFVNIAVVLGLLPVLGVPLPLLSSGGSALLTSLLAIGIVLSVCRETAKHDSEVAHRQPTARKTR
ncbi:putative lipid II flippase FtsW [Gulosibacter bifidus]|uniref:Probable peptidoglycan glycosyltransferase FtsW n=1 Tax=Gulosibacter bifidus TaxID=272239 RepID=A0ABW5RGU6_9MICO|nr:putative lipid II flippase FtsW [Gulosibacter bifidus]